MDPIFHFLSGFPRLSDFHGHPSHFGHHHICPAHIGLTPIRRSFIRSGVALGSIMADARGAGKEKSQK